MMNVLWNNKKIWTLILFFCASILSFAKLVELPQGGSVTYFSLLMVWLITFFYGFRHGLWVSLLFGFVRFFITYLTGEYINYHPVSLILEYPLAFGVFALGDFVKLPEKWKLRVGFLVGAVCQLILYVISAMLFYPWEKEGMLANLIYSIFYDGSVILFESLLTIFLLFVPPAVEAILYLKYIATSENDDHTLEYF